VAAWAVAAGWAVAGWAAGFTYASKLDSNAKIVLFPVELPGVRLAHLKEACMERAEDGETHGQKRRLRTFPKLVLGGSVTTA